MAEYETRADLKGKLDERDALIADMAKRLEALEKGQSLSATDQARLRAAEAELASLRVNVVSVTPRGPAPKHIPYRGMVQARIDCHVAGELRFGPDKNHPNRPPAGKEQGDVFLVDVPVLWSDDPYVPVIVKRTRDDGLPETVPNPDAPTAVDFRFRPRGTDAFTAMNSRAVVAGDY